MRFPRAAAPKSGPNTATPIPPEVASPEAREPVGLWSQKLDLIVRNPALFTMKDYRILLTFEDQFPDPQLLKSAHNSSYPLFLPPLPLSDWKFTGYYSIPYVSCGIAVFQKIPSFIKDLQG
jgi:hypothetical protein